MNDEPASSGRGNTCANDAVAWFQSLGAEQQLHVMSVGSESLRRSRPRVWFALALAILLVVLTGYMYYLALKTLEIDYFNLSIQSSFMAGVVFGLFLGVFQSKRCAKPRPKQT